MKLSAMSILSALALSLMPAAAEDSLGTWLSDLNQHGRESWKTGKLSAFATAYQQRIESNDADYEARILHAATIILQLGENKNVAAYAKKFGFTLDYLGMKAVGKASAPSSWPTLNAMVDTFVNEGVPVLKSALQDLEAIPSDWGGSVLLSAEEYPVDEDTEVDIGDVLYARAGIEAAIGTAYFAQGYDLTVDYAKGKSALDYEETIPVVKKAPSVEADEGWDGAVADSHAKMLFCGSKLYMRLSFGRKILDMNSLDDLYLEFSNVKSGTRYVLRVWNDLNMYADDTVSDYRAIFGKPGAVSAYLSAGYNAGPYPEWEDFFADYDWENYDGEDYAARENRYWEAVDAWEARMEAARKKALANLNQPRFERYEDAENGIVTLVVDLSKTSGMSTAGTWAVDGSARARLDWIIDEENSTCYRDYESMDVYFSESEATVYKLLTEQTKFMAQVRNQSSLATSKVWMTAALTCAKNADAAVQARPDDGKMHFVEYDPIDADVLSRARNLTDKALAALDSPQEVNVQEEVFGERDAPFDVTLLPNEGLMHVYLGALFEGKITHDLMPEFQKGEYGGAVPVVETVRDPTLAGLLPEFSKQTWVSLVRDLGREVAHQTVTVKLDGNGGKIATASLALDFDEEAEECVYPKLPVPNSRAGYMFIGWGTDKTGGETVSAGDFYDAAMFAGAKTPTLYAQWLKFYKVTLKDADASAAWSWAEGQEEFEELAGDLDLPSEIKGKGTLMVPEGALVEIKAPETSNVKGKELVFQKWTVAPAKANLGGDFRVTDYGAQLSMPGADITLQAAYIDESTCGRLSVYINNGYLFPIKQYGEGYEVVSIIHPPLAAFEWSPDGGKTWYKISGEYHPEWYEEDASESYYYNNDTYALLKAGTYTLTWRSIDPNWQAPSTKASVKVVAGEEPCNYLMKLNERFTYIPQVVVDVMTYENGECVLSSVGGTVTMSPKDGLVPLGKPLALSAKAAKNYVFQGWALGREWMYEDGFSSVAASTKVETFLDWHDTSFGFSGSSLESAYYSLDWLIDPADLKIHVKAVFKALSDYRPEDIVFSSFGSREVVEDGGTASVDIYGAVGCALVSDSEEEGASDGYCIACSSAAFPLTYKLNGKLPAGLKFDAKKGVLSGVPTKAGNTTVTITATDPAKNSRNLTVNIHVRKLPDWVVGDFRAVTISTVYLDLCGDESYEQANGLLELSVASTGKVSAKFLHRGGTKSWSGNLIWYPDEEDLDADGSYAFMKEDATDYVKKGISAWFYSDGTFDGDVGADFKAGKDEHWVGGYFTGMRQDKDLLEKSDFLDKYYTFAFGPEEEEEASMPSGYGYLTIKTDKKGGAKVTGQLPDGTKVSMSALVLPYRADEEEESTDEVRARLYLFVSPSSYNKEDWFAMALSIAPDGTVSSEDVAVWTPAGLTEFLGEGSLYSAAQTLENYYWNFFCDYNDQVQLEYSYKAYRESETTGKMEPFTAYDYAYAADFDGCLFNVAVKGDKKGAIALDAKNPASPKLTFSFAKATGIFTGKATAYFDYDLPNCKLNKTTQAVEVTHTKQHKTATLPYAGVMIADGEGGYIGLGAAVHTFKYTDFDENDRAKTLTEKISLPVTLKAPDDEQ